MLVEIAGRSNGNLFLKPQRAQSERISQQEKHHSEDLIDGEFRFTIWHFITLGTIRLNPKPYSLTFRLTLFMTTFLQLNLPSCVMNVIA